VIVHGFLIGALFAIVMVNAGDHRKVGKVDFPIEVVQHFPAYPIQPPVVRGPAHPKLPDVVSKPIPVVDPPPDADPLPTPGTPGVPGPVEKPGTGTGDIDNPSVSGIVGTVDDVPPDTVFIPREFEPTPLDINENPAFPFVAQKTGLSGKVVVKVYVDKQGFVKRWMIQQAVPAGLGFEDEVLKVIPKWRFAPAIQQGNPVGVWVSIPFVFKFKR
jgi:TonB family protein